MKEINGFPDYFVTREGKVYSKKKWKGHPKGELRQIKAQYDRHGYCKVYLSINGKRKFFAIHRLVALTYIPNPENLPQVNHINEDKSDNRVENLEWMNNSNNSTYSQAKLYTIEHKNGDKFDVFGLRKWCKNNEIDHGHICATLRGRARWCQDYRIVSIRELSQEERRAHLQDAMITSTTG